MDNKLLSIGAMRASMSGQQPSHSSFLVRLLYKRLSHKDCLAACLLCMRDMLRSEDARLSRKKKTSPLCL